MFAETGGIALVLFILLAFGYSRIEGLPCCNEVVNDTGQFVGHCGDRFWCSELTSERLTRTCVQVKECKEQGRAIIGPGIGLPWSPFSGEADQRMSPEGPAAADRPGREDRSGGGTTAGTDKTYLRWRRSMPVPSQSLAGLTPHNSLRHIMCGSTEGTGLCGGWPVTAIPAATVR